MRKINMQPVKLSMSMLLKDTYINQIILKLLKAKVGNKQTIIESSKGPRTSQDP